MLVTGSKSRLGRKNKMSIRLTQGGHFFSRSLPALSPSVESVEVVVDGWDCIIYPSQQAEQLNITKLMEAAGVEPQGKRIVEATIDGPVRYAMAIEQTTLEAIEQWAEGHELAYRSPLQEAVARALRGTRREITVALRLSEKVLYAALCRQGRLLYAEALPAEGEQTALYTLATLGKEFDMAKAEIILSAEKEADVAMKNHKKLLKRYFKRVKTE